jgi:superfamily II DNA/RNA helicase
MAAIIAGIRQWLRDNQNTPVAGLRTGGLPVAQWKSIIFKKRNLGSLSSQEQSDSGCKQSWWKRLFSRKNQNADSTSNRASSASSNPPFKESTQIDENAELIRQADASRRNSDGRFDNSASGNNTSGRSNRGRPNDGQFNNEERNNGRSKSLGRKSNRRISSSKLSDTAQTEKPSSESNSRSGRSGITGNARSEAPKNRAKNGGKTSKENTGRSRATRKDSELQSKVTLETADAYWFGAQQVSYDTALALKTIGYEEPTPIQTDCIGPLLGGNDVVGQAHTGTGKTAAFGIPMVEQVDPSQNFIQGLVLVPTRELAMQVRDELARLSQFRKMGVVACYGGQPIARQITALERNAQIVVGTPGRVLDHIGRGTLRLGDVRILVLDEADEMLDIGFLPDIERILGNIPRDRQTALFSATLPPPIRGIVGRHMKSPTWIRIGDEVETAPDVRQIYYEVLEQDRVRACVQLLKTQTNDGKVLLFRRTKAGVDNLTQALQRQGIAVLGIHGGLVQGERNAAMRSFHSGDVKVLVATNVAARGLDIPEISHVVNYDMPQNLEEYVHRIGRTARMGRHGVAITFVSEWDFEFFDLLQESLGTKLTIEKLAF